MNLLSLWLLIFLIAMMGVLPTLVDSGFLAVVATHTMEALVSFESPEGLSKVVAESRGFEPRQK
jgi:hypothetical protein